MTIRRQILIHVVPLFACFGAIGGFLVWRLQTVAAERTFEDASRSLAVTLAEFITPADVAALAAGTPVGETALGRALPRLDRWSIAARIYLLDPGSGRVLLDTGDDDPPKPDPGVISGLTSDEVRRLPVRIDGNGRHVQPLIALTSHTAAVLGVEISADLYFAQRAAILSGAENDVVVAAVIGVIISFVLAGILGRQIRQLRQAADRIGGGDAPVEPPSRLIQEVADLGNTFEVMHSVLEETVARTRRSLVENDFFRSQGTLTAVLQQELQPDHAWRGAGAEAAWFFVGRPVAASFAGAVELGPREGAAFVGLAGPAGQLQPALRAQAARAFLADTLGRRPLAEAAEDARTLFALIDLVVVRWQDQTITCSSTGDHSVAPDRALWSSGAKLSLSCLGPRGRERLSLYQANFADHAPAQAIDDLPSLFDGPETGVILLLRRAGA